MAEWVQLLASGVLLLAFWEGAREWRSHRGNAEEVEEMAPRDGSAIVGGQQSGQFVHGNTPA